MRAGFVRMLDVGGLPRAFWWLWTGTLVNRTGGFVAPFLAYYLTGSLRHSAAFAGFVAALVAVGAAISAVVGGVLADRLWRRPTLLTAQVSSALTLVALGFAHTAVLIAVLAFLSGLTNNAARPAMSALIADIVEPGDRLRAYALNYWAINLGFAVAMISAGLLASQSYLLLFLGDAGTTLACAFLIFLKVPESYRPVRRADGSTASRAERGGLGDVLRDRSFMWFLVLATLIAAVYTQCNSTQPIAMARDGLSPTVYGMVSALNGILIGVLQLPLTRWIRRFSFSPVLAISALLIGGGFAVPLLIPVLGHPLAIYTLSVSVWTIGEIGNAPTEAAVVADLAPAHMRGRYQGMFNFSWSTAGVIGPLAGGVTLASAGTAAVWWACLGGGLVATAGWLLFGRRMLGSGGADAVGAPADQVDVVALVEPTGEVGTAVVLGSGS